MSSDNLVFIEDSIVVDNEEREDSLYEVQQVKKYGDEEKQEEVQEEEENVIEKNPLCEYDEVFVDESKIQDEINLIQDEINKANNEEEIVIYEECDVKDSSTQTNSNSNSKLSTKNPSVQPSVQPSVHASVVHSVVHSAKQSAKVSANQTVIHSVKASVNPSKQASAKPSANPSRIPSVVPSVVQSKQASANPSRIPSVVQSKQESANPSRIPSVVPSVVHSKHASANPSVVQSKQASRIPSVNPSRIPSAHASANPSAQASRIPSVNPSRIPSAHASATTSRRGSFSHVPIEDTLPEFQGIPEEQFVLNMEPEIITQAKESTRNRKKDRLNLANDILAELPISIRYNEGIYIDNDEKLDNYIDDWKNWTEDGLDQLKILLEQIAVDELKYKRMSTINIGCTKAIQMGLMIVGSAIVYIQASGKASPETINDFNIASGGITTIASLCLSVFAFNKKGPHYSKVYQTLQQLRCWIEAKLVLPIEKRFSPYDIYTISRKAYDVIMLEAKTGLESSK